MVVGFADAEMGLWGMTGASMGLDSSICESSWDFAFYCLFTESRVFVSRVRKCTRASCPCTRKAA
jgi:hypothetical protein